MVVIRLAVLIVVMVATIPFVIGPQADAGVLTGTPAAPWVTNPPVDRGLGAVGLAVWALAGLACSTWIWTRGER